MSRKAGQNKMIKVGYKEGKYKGICATGTTEEKAQANLRNKIYRKYKKELIDSLTSTDIENLYRCFELMTSCEEETQEEIDLSGNCCGFTSLKQVDDMGTKLINLQRIIELQEQK
jgi:hypothetical protein